MCSHQLKTREAPTWLKWGVSALIVIHFAAILTAITGLAVGYAAPPRLCALMNKKFAPYLEFVFLQNPYRFYAPNPGCDPTIWARIRYSDGSVRWLEFPHPPESALPVVRLRLLSMPRSAVETIPVGETPGEVILSPMSRICLASYVRGLVRSHPMDDEQGLPLLTEDVEIYRIEQRCMVPREAREGWNFSDLGLREATYLGTYFVNGEMRESPRGEPVPIHELAARIIQEDAGIEQSLASSALPGPIIALLDEHPELAEGHETDFPEAVRVAIESRAPDQVRAAPHELAVENTTTRYSVDDASSMSSPQLSHANSVAVGTP